MLRTFESQISKTGANLDNENSETNLHTDLFNTVYHTTMTSLKIP